MRVDNSPHGTRLMFRVGRWHARDESRAQCGHRCGHWWPIAEQKVLR